MTHESLSSPALKQTERAMAKTVPMGFHAHKCIPTHSLSPRVSSLVQNVHRWTLKYNQIKTHMSPHPLVIIFPLIFRRIIIPESFCNSFFLQLLLAAIVLSNNVPVSFVSPIILQHLRPPNVWAVTMNKK